MNKSSQYAPSSGLLSIYAKVAFVVALVTANATAYAQIERAKALEIWNPNSPSNSFFITYEAGTETYGLNMGKAKPVTGSLFFAGVITGDTVKFESLAPGTSGQVLVGGSVPSWSSAKDLFWSLTGNTLSGVAPEPTQRLGSTNNYDLVLQSGGVERFRIKPFSPGFFLPDIPSTQRTILTINGAPFLDFSGSATATSADGNVFLGVGAGNPLTSGLQNVGIGPNALGSITTGGANIGIGRGVLLTCTTCDGNIAFGTNALLEANSSAVSTNIAIGLTALFALTSGRDNIVMGTSAAANATTSNRNIVLGESAMRVTGVVNLGSDNIAIGARTLLSLNASSYNVAIGRDAGHDVTTGEMNTFLGYSSGFVNGQPQRSRSTAIGAYASVNANDAVVIGAIAGFNGASVSQFVGIGRRTPLRRLHVAAGGTDYVAGTPLIRDEFMTGTPNTTAYAAGDGVVVATTDGDLYKKRGANAQAAIGIHSLIVNGAAAPAVIYNDVAVGFDLVGDEVITGVVVNLGGGVADAIPIAITEIDGAADQISFVTQAAIGNAAQVHFIFVRP